MATLEVSQVYREHFAFVWRILRRLGIPLDALEDTAQEVFIVVHRRWDTYRHDVPIRSWLFGITRRVAADTRRRLQRTSARYSDRGDLDQRPAPSNEVRQLEAEEFVARFLDSLDDDKRMVFILVDIEGFTVPEISSALDVNLNTIYARLRAARLRLRASRDQWLASAATANSPS